MPDKLNRSQPDKWFMPFRRLQTATLAPDETLAMILYFEIESQNETIAHNMFLIVRKGNKAIARNIISLNNNENLADDLAEYPIENEKDLVEEIRNHGLMIAAMLASNSDQSIKLNTEVPAFYMQTPSFATNAETVEKLNEDNDPRGNSAKEAIFNILGLNQTSLKINSKTGQAELNHSINFQNEAILGHPMTMQVHEDLKATTNLQKAAAEMALIKKYGKKPMQELAKKMNYQWVGQKYTRTIKNKSTNHVK
ncbi:MAG: hypothetical protein V1920_06400 [Bacillota bacterium]